jgi:IS30 family transposase
MLSHIDVRTVVDFLKGALGDCSNRMIASLINVNESTISSNLSRSIEELMTKKTGKRLTTFAVVVSHFYEKGLKSEAILDLISIPIYPDLDGNLDSIISAVAQEKYSANTLIQLGEMAYVEYQRKHHERNITGEHIKKLLSV